MSKSEKRKMRRNILKDKKGMGLNETLTGFTLIGATLFLLVLLIYVFGVVYSGLEDTAETQTVTNETNTYINTTGDTLSGASSTGEPRSFTLTAIWAVDSGVYNISVPLANGTVSSAGVITNATVTTYANTSVSYTYLNNSAEQQASRDAGTNTTNAIPLVGILFIIVAVGALITILIISMMGGRRRS